MKEKAQTIRYSNKAEFRARNLDADINTPQVRALEGRKNDQALKSAQLKNRHYEVIGGKRFLVVS